jgi:hypothetical protein
MKDLFILWFKSADERSLLIWIFVGFSADITFATTAYYPEWFHVVSVKAMQIHFVFQQGSAMSFRHTLSSLTHTSSVLLCKHQVCWYVEWALKKFWINKFLFSKT